MLATIGAPMAVCLVVLMLAPRDGHRLRDDRIPAHGHRSPAHPRLRKASHRLSAGHYRWADNLPGIAKRCAVDQSIPEADLHQDFGEYETTFGRCGLPASGR